MGSTTRRFEKEHLPEVFVMEAELGCHNGDVA